jgi:hypothetical protein
MNSAKKNRVGMMNPIHKAKNIGNREVITHLNAPLSQYLTPLVRLLSVGPLTVPEYNSWAELHGKG